MTKRFHLIRVDDYEEGVVETTLYSSDNLEAMASVISFYSGQLKPNQHLEVRELLDDEMKLIKIV